MRIVACTIAAYVKFRAWMRRKAHDWCELWMETVVCMLVSLVRRSFCFAVLAFRVETLYLARRFCGLRDCNVNPIFSDWFL
jgi:hypothetical protein